MKNVNIILSTLTLQFLLIDPTWSIEPNPYMLPDHGNLLTNYEKENDPRKKIRTC